MKTIETVERIEVILDAMQTCQDYFDIGEKVESSALINQELIHMVNYGIKVLKQHLLEGTA